MNPLLFKVLAFLFPLQWGPRYSRLNKTPSLRELRVIRFLICAKHFLWRNLRPSRNSLYEQSESVRRLEQRFQAFSIPPLTISDDDLQDLPAIRLLWVVHPKDFFVLPQSVIGALRHVKNPIAAIDVVSPAPAKVDKLLSPLLAGEIAVTYWRDSEIIPEHLNEALFRGFPTHGGWATQQVIKILVALKQSSDATLVIDSDTVLLRDKVWLTSDGRQLLYFRGFTNHRYLHYLKIWEAEGIDSMKSFVTHHMLYQPKILEAAISSVFGSTRPEALVTAIIDSAQKLGFPEFSLDYELYGNFIYARHPDNYRLDKYSNIGRMRPASPEKLTSELQKLRNLGSHNSASFHRPNR